MYKIKSHSANPSPFKKLKDKAIKLSFLNRRHYTIHFIYYEGTWYFFAINQIYASGGGRTIRGF